MERGGALPEGFVSLQGSRTRSSSAGPEDACRPMSSSKMRAGHTDGWTDSSAHFFAFSARFLLHLMLTRLQRHARRESILGPSPARHNCEGAYLWAFLRPL